MEIIIKQWVGRRRPALIKKTIHAVCKLIMKDETLEKIKRVEVRILRRLPSLGTCQNKGNGVFEIDVSERLCRTKLISTLAHEVTHMNQFAEGRLASGSGLFVWLERSYNADCTHEEYLSRPWEAEARSVEESYLKILEGRTNKRSFQ